MRPRHTCRWRPARRSCRRRPGTISRPGSASCSSSGMPLPRSPLPRSSSRAGTCSRPSVSLALVIDLVGELARARIGGTYNQYTRSELRRARLRTYLTAHTRADTILVGEAAGYRGARVSGVPFTSERQLTGGGSAEATATIVHRVLQELGIEDDVLLWNVVPTHPGTATSNRRPTRAEVEAARPFLAQLAHG